MCMACMTQKPCRLLSHHCCVALLCGVAGASGPIPWRVRCLPTASRQESWPALSPSLTDGQAGQLEAHVGS
ncbi:hypothetical protein V8C86DRAFT_2844955 [Haematococcus lacustris]